MRKASLTLTLVSLLAGCAGSAAPTIQADPTGSSPCATTSPAPLGAVAIELTAPTSLVSGTSVPIVATAIDPNGVRTDATELVTWTSSDFLRASASGGRLYGVGAGRVTISGTLGEIAGSIDVDVLPMTLIALSISADSETARAGAVTSWHVVGRYSDGTSLDLTDAATWATSDDSVAIVDGAGRIHAMAAGMTTVSALVGSQRASAPMLVTDAVLIGLRVEAPSPALSVGGVEQLVATGLYSDGATADLTAMVAWYSSGTSTATVWQGRVQAVSAGSVTISAATGDLLASTGLTIGQ